MNENTLLNSPVNAAIAPAVIAPAVIASAVIAPAVAIEHSQVHSEHSVTAHSASEHGAHGSHEPHLHHHFEDMAQQRESTLLGMWAFLCTEVMMFGGLMFAYTLYRHYFFPAFQAGSHHLDITLGTINTFVLLFSSLTMAFAVRNAQLRERKKMVSCLIATMVLGAVFIGIKAKEWTHDYHIGLVPVLNWNPELAYSEKGEGHDESAAAMPAAATSSTRSAEASGGAMASNAYDARTNSATTSSKLYENPTAASTLVESSGKLINKNNLQMFFFLYFCMTGLHAIHMIIGMFIVAYMTWLGWKGFFTNGNDQPIELLGLYWHFVDIVWIFLFPLLYLIGTRHTG